MSTPSQHHFSNGKAPLRMRSSSSCLLFTVVIIAVAIWNNSLVNGAPAKLDALVETTPFNLNLQPPVFEASFSGDDKKTRDSYGNPIASLKPIDTPDGRKVVSAQGLQFEIPNYASGITELKKPSDDLLPPFVGEFSKDLQKPSNTTSEGPNNNDDSRVKDKATAGRYVFVSTNFAGDAAVGDSNDLLRIERQQPVPKIASNISNTDNKGDVAITRHKQTTLHIDTDVTTNTNKPNPTNPIDLHQQQSPIMAASSQSYIAQTSQLIESPSSSSHLSSSPPPPHRSVSHLKTSPIYSSTTTSSRSQTQLSAYYPLSNGNFNYPNVPTDVSIIDRIASKYHNPLPTLDPIAVAVPNDSSESTFTTITSSPTATDVHIENIPLVEVKDSAAVTASLKRLPEYIVELNDPDIGGPVDYIPADDNKGLSIIAWDLLPPFDADPAVINAPSKQRVHEAATTSHSVSSHASTAATSGRNSTEDQQQQHTHIKTSQTTPSPEYNTESTTKFSRTQQSNRGNVHYSSTTPRTTTTKRPTTTTSTTTTTTTTTRRPTTTPRTTTTTTKAPRTTSTTPQPDSSEFFKLEAGDSYTLPSWLADFDDPDLDVAVAYVVPEDVNNYNHTIARDILPPLEPYTDLNVVNVTPPPGFKGSKQSHLTTTTTPTTTTTRKTTTTTTTPKPTTTTRRSAVTSSQHWVRAKVTSPPPSARPNTSSFSNQFTSSSQTFNSPPTLTTASAGNSNLAQRTTTSTSTTTTTTTVKPKTTLNSFNHPLSNTDKISSEEVSSEDNQRQQNPFLSGVNKPQPFSKPAATTTTRRTTTTTTTTTTPAPKAKVDPNPFEATIPPWLKDFDYPDVGPGVPFIYNPKDDESAVDADIQPPSMANAAFDTAAATKATTSFVTSPTSADSFLNSQNQQSFSNKFSSSATSLTPSSSIPSKVTLPLPSIVLNQDDNSVTQPPNTFVRPTPTLPAEDNNASKKTSSSFNTHFPARFEPSAGAISTDIPTKVPLGADRESFPPFNTPATGSSGSSIPTKTTFSKSEDGKVITNNIFLSGGATQTAIPTKSSGTTIPVNTQQKDNIGNTSPGFTKPSTADASFNQFTTSSGASGFVTAPSAASSEGTKYTGRFGGPPGVLAPNAKPAGFVTAPTTSVTPQSLNKQSTTAVAAAATTSAANNSNLSGKFTGSFGGPPGVLTPYDNVKSA